MFRVSLGTGNGFLYTLAPTITPTLQGTVTKTYDGLTAATLAAGNFKTTGIGEVDGDTVVLSNPATGIYGSAHAGSGILVTANSASAISSATNGGATVFGYQISGAPASGTVGTINAAQLTASASITAAPKTYDGLLAASTSTVSGSTSGAVGTDTVALDTSGVSLNYNSAHVASATTISATGSVALGTLTSVGSGTQDGTAGNRVVAQAGDYVLAGQPTIAPVAGSITPAAINLAGARAYDGTVDFTAGAFTPMITGTVGGETLTIASGTGTVPLKDVSAGTQTLTTGTLALGDGTGLASNYTLLGGTHTGTITAKALTAGIIGNPTKTYDSTATATLTSGNYSLSGFVGTESATATQTAGLYDSANAGRRTVTATLAGGDFIAGAGTLLSNYTLPTSANGAGTISPATLTFLANAASRERGDPNPTFNGTVTGFVGGESLVTATTGTLAFTSPATQSSVEGQYAINGNGLTANNGNYVFVQAPSNATALTITAPVNFLWTAGSGGSWETGSNWNKGFAPVNGVVVTIPDIGAPGVSETITYSGGTTNVKTVTSFEAFTLAGGTLNLGTSAADVSTFAQLTLAGGTLGGAGTVNVATTNILAGGILSGTGTIVGNVNNVSGTVSPGNSPGILTIGGNYVQGSGGTLAVEIGGTTAGTQYDQLVVTGNATLDGALNVTLINAFVPVTGNTFTVVQSGGTVSGTFATTSFPAKQWLHRFRQKECLR